jgi:hypothetical protein
MKEQLGHRLRLKGAKNRMAGFAHVGKPQRAQEMHNTWKWLFAASLLVAPAARAEEPHLELIRGLRAGGEPQLALEYMQEKLSGKLPPEMAVVLSLELARTRVEIARQENEEGKRLALFAAARAEFDSFLKANPNHPLVPQARFEIARLIAAQGKEAVNRARRAEGDARVKALRDARPAFEAAGKQLADAAKQLKTQLDTLANPTTPEEKATARDTALSWLQAQLEQGMNLYHLAQTHATEERASTDEIKKRAELLSDAGKVFTRLMTEDTKQPICWLARAWLARCYFENDDYGKATEQFDAVQGEKGPHADEARRVAGYFRILLVRKQGSATLGQQLTQLQNWAERYAPYMTTPEGCGIRYALADVLEKQAYLRDGIKLNDKGRPISVSADSAVKLKAAERQLRSLTEFENDFSDRAANKRMRIILAIAIRETPDRNPAKLTTFENCYLLALLEISELNEAIKEPKVADNPDEVVKTTKAHFSRAARALERGLKLVQPADPAKEVLDARILLVFAQLKAGNNYQAAVMGEHLARGMTRTGRGAVPALYALQAYRNVMLETKARGDAKEDELRTDREQVRRMASDMERLWPNDAPTDTARHALGTLYFTEGDFVKALETYARVTPNYVSLAFLRNEQGTACFNLQKDRKVAAAVKQQWFQTITAELDRMPDLGQGAEPETAYAYCLARMQLGYLLLLEGKQFARIEQIGKAMLEKSAGYSLAEKAGEVKFTAQALMLSGLHGRILELVKAHRHADAAALYQPIVADLEKNGVPDDESAGRARLALTAVIQLALRSSIQEGQLDRAQGLLRLLEKASAGQPGGASGPLVSVLRELLALISDMRKNDPSRLKETMDKFATFLDTLAKQKNLSKDVKIFLAQGFDSLDKPSRAVELLSSITAPTEKDPGKPPPAPPETAPEAERTRYEEAKNKYDAARQTHDQAWKTYWFGQLIHVRALRAAGRLEQDKEARAKTFQAADKMLDEMIGTPQKQGWAFNSLEVRRERIFILEDQEKWLPARDAWLAMQKPFIGKFNQPPKDDKEARLRAAYFEIRFYMFRLLYKNALALKDTKKRDGNIKRIAEQIVDLEKDARTADFGGANVKKLYQDWLEDEPVMRKAYEAARGRVLLGADAAGQ